MPALVDQLDGALHIAAFDTRVTAELLLVIINPAGLRPRRTGCRTAYRIRLSHRRSALAHGAEEWLRTSRWSIRYSSRKRPGRAAPDRRHSAPYCAAPDIRKRARVCSRRRSTGRGTSSTLPFSVRTRD